MGQGSITIEREQDRKRRPEKVRSDRSEYLAAKDAKHRDRRNDRRAKNTAARLASDAWDAGEVDA